MKDDNISRQAVIELVGDLVKGILSDSRTVSMKMSPDYLFENLYKPIRQMSTARTESNWILCSERMPEEHEWIRFGTTISDEVYVTFEASDGEKFVIQTTFQNGKLSHANEQLMKAWYKGAKPIAWMPFPEPYNAESEV